MGSSVRDSGMSKIKCVRDDHTGNIYCVAPITGKLYKYRPPEEVTVNSIPPVVMKALFKPSWFDMEMEYVNEDRDRG